MNFNLFTDTTTTPVEPTLSWWETMLNQITEWIKNNGVRILIGLAVLIIGFFVIKIFLFLLKRTFKKFTKIEQITKSFIISTIKILLYILLLFIVSLILGIPVSGFIALLSIVGLACSLAIQDSLANLFNGLIIVTNKPFKTGEYISCNGNEGIVKSINTMTTTLVTPDNKEIIIPNTIMIKSEITNYDRLGIRRLDLKFDIGYEADIKKAKDVILECAKSDGRVYLNRPIQVQLSNFLASSIELTLKCWCDKEDYWDLKFLFNELIFNELKKNNIPINYNQLEVHLLKDYPASHIDETPIPTRKEKVRPEDDDLLKTIEKNLDKVNKKQKERINKRKTELKENKK